MVIFKMIRRFSYPGRPSDRCRFRFLTRDRWEIREHRDWIKLSELKFGWRTVQYETEIENSSIEGSVKNGWRLDKDAWNEERLENI